MGLKFTWFPKFTDTVAKVPEGQRGTLLWALVLYGTYGEEADLGWPLDAIFESLRDDIDCSKRAIESGKRGGRGNAKAPLQSDKTPFADVESTLCDGENGGSGKAEANTRQDSTRQDKTKRERFAPPSVEEVREYIAEKGYRFDAESFVAFYESKGWKVGREPMKSWKAACTTWEKRRGKEEVDGDASPYSDL